MNIQINKPEAEKTTEYPKLMISEDGLIVFFSKPKRGMALNGTSWLDAYSEYWDMSAFTDFTGSITLSNK